MRSCIQNVRRRIAGRPRRRRTAARATAGNATSVRATALSTATALGLLAVAAACSAGTGESSGTGSAGAPATAAVAAVSAEINQLRDNYGKQIVAIQLTNNTPGALTVLGAELGSALFAASIAWQPPAGGIDLPPGQAKILAAQLPAPACGPRTDQSPGGATVTLRMAAAPGTGPATTLPAADPYGVLARNNAEMCLAQAAAAVAAIRLEPELEVSADARSAVVRLAIAPRSTPGAVNPGAAGTLTIDRIDGTTLLEEDPAAPWPRSVSVVPGGKSQELRLGIRPARCDPHSVAEDKVGTLLPLRVHAGGRDGVLKIDAGALLRGRIYEFVSTACGRQ
ncbi:hypothetical protein [Arthrobacter sp. CG_A4]|uniref:hypothetical protein n=1 Tax=Arthrobacter sp. CG_A4 TaxID=3071706 RepID=UPI002DFDCFD6|nr:hypothetical protein [Arthrobacter sp. CG_A4]